MNQFVNAVRSKNPVRTTTTNGMAAFKSTLRANVDLFGQLGAFRGKDVTTLFNTALIEDSELAIRIALWGRDIRGGAGERKLFRDILQHLEQVNPDYLLRTNLLRKVPELGRFDDLLVFRTEEVKAAAFEIIHEAIQAGNGLAAKWLPRKGLIAVELRNYFGMSPKQYRKTLVNLTKVVETQMCNREFNAINFNHVPSLAMSRYTKAFGKRAPEAFGAWKEALKKGDPKVAKVNAGAVYPYDIIKTVKHGDKSVADAQWDALPNFIGDANVLPVVDVSGSMGCAAGTNGNVTCMDVAISLGMYCASKNTGAFKDLFLTFSSNPEFVHLTGSLSQRYAKMSQSNWQMSTDLEAAMNRILETAKKNRVPASDMPTALLIMSDMQFNQCVGKSSGKSSGRLSGWAYGGDMSGGKHTKRAMEMISDQFHSAGYEMPAIIFWNINASGNVPVTFDESGTALVSGFSPSIMKSILSADLNNMTPEGIMRKTVMAEKYDFR